MVKKAIFIIGLSFMLYSIVCAEEQDTKKYPFFPSLINTVTGKPIKATDFTSPDVCGGCHTDIYKQWKGSMHASAFVDPVFQALWKLGAKETDGLTDNLCGGCHAAVGVVSNDLIFKEGDFQTSDIAKRGVHCDVCHSIKSSTFLETPTYEPQNASIILDPGDIKRGPYKDAESPFHDTAFSELHTKSEFCANCHHVFHPVTNFHIERTYDEWKYSVYAQKGIQCQDCHMMPVEKAIEAARTLQRPKNPGQPCITGPKRKQMYTHEFVGANFTVTSLLKHNMHAEIARKRLQSAAELTLSVPDEVRAGGLATITVKVTNAGAGHNLPTSLTEVRQMWLDVQVIDQQGNELLRSGRVDSEGNIDKNAKIFNAYAVDKDGRHTVKPWEIARFEYNNTIPPKGSATERFTLFVHSGIKGELKVKAVLRYRSYPQSVANFLLGEDAPVLPIVDMASADGKIKITQ